MERRVWTVEASPDMNNNERLRNFSDDNISLQDENLLPLDDDLVMPVYSEKTTITIQPRSRDLPEERDPIPISTDGWQTTTFSQFIPLSGLDFLIGAEELVIQQTVELNDILAYVESENRYLVKVPLGETLYVAAENSSTTERQLCGSARGFEMILCDQSRQEAMRLKRRFACSTCCFGCYLQELQVFTSAGHLIGKIQQEWSMIVPSFLLISSSGETVYRIEGAKALCLCCVNRSSEFKILSRDGMTHLSSIIHEWNDTLHGYNIVIRFPSENMDQKFKALFLGAGFLLEYMYFETKKRASCFRCCK